MKEIQNRLKNRTDKIRIVVTGRNDISYISSMQSYFLKFYEVDNSSIQYFGQNKVNNSKILSKNNLEKFESAFRQGDLILFIPNALIPQQRLINNLQEGNNLHLIMRTESPYYFEIPEIRHLLKFLMLRKNAEALGSRMVYREVDFAIYEVI